ncbi:MAG TPA: hypothetical protein VNW29_07445 [Candidatus Sulfotelmatobacter sp.]|jgi:hypothetical protein|nr:hypothetical protein [Candidatus Sulfotelmatobacter sp.]
MVNPEKAPQNTGELADGGQRARRNRISKWLMTRGFSAAALGTLGVAGYLLLIGGTAAVSLVAPAFVVAAGVAAAGGVSLAATGVGKRLIDSFRG